MADLGLTREYNQELGELLDQFDMEFKVPGHKEPEVVFSISSVVGDDNVNTTSSLDYGLAIILAGPILTGIKISWTDVGFSQHLFNYAEGWILTPPAEHASFDMVNKYHKGRGIPFVLDLVKFKNLSAVRKQSDMNVDLESKFRNLAEMASWVHRRWFTWVFHQFALIIGIEIYDFVRGRRFPFLYKSESGCGGAPPFGSLVTAAGALFKYQRGKAQHTILGIMDDANKIHQGMRSPQDALFTEGLHASLAGDKYWLEYQSECERRRSALKGTGVAFVSPYEQEVNTIIPDQLQKTATAIAPKDFTTGAVIAFLRNRGFVYTESDLVSFINNQEKILAVWGQTPIHDVLDVLEEREERLKEAFLNRLSTTIKGAIDPVVYSRLLSIENVFDPRSLEIMRDYYALRVEQLMSISSLVYNRRIRLWTTDEIRRFYATATESIRDAFHKSVDLRFIPDISKVHNLPDRIQLDRDISDWLSSGPLQELLEDTIPPGVGPDDPKIYREACRLVVEGGLKKSHLIILVSDDKKLQFGLFTQLLRNFSDLNFIMKVLVVSHYENLRMLGGARPVAWFNQYNLKDHESKPLKFVGSIIGDLETVREDLGEIPLIHMLYDQANIRRRLKLFVPEGNRNKRRLMFGGYLDISSAVPQQMCDHMAEIWALPCFDKVPTNQVVYGNRNFTRLRSPRTISDWI